MDSHAVVRNNTEGPLCPVSLCGNILQSKSPAEPRLSRLRPDGQRGWDKNLPTEIHCPTAHRGVAGGGQDQVVPGRCVRVIITVVIVYKYLERRAQPHSGAPAQGNSLGFSPVKGVEGREGGACGPPCCLEP